MAEHRSPKESGQTLVILAIGMVGLIAFLALALDGGMTYAKRRRAQNAADAGALAGARYVCENPDVTTATDVAEEYAIIRNGADTADVTFPTTNSIRVVTTVTTGTFFAWVVGRNDITVEARATASCTPPTTSESVMPSAYPCVPPEGGGSESDDCEVVYYNDEEDLDWNIENGRIVIMMDSDPSTYACLPPPGTIDCDPDGDNINNIIETDSRGWLDLDGGPSSPEEIVGWIENGFPGTVFAHLWLGRQPGVNDTIFNAVKYDDPFNSVDIHDDRDLSNEIHEGSIVVVPIFDLFCDTGPPSTGCPSLYEDIDSERPRNGEEQTYYRIVAFARFQIMCVHSEGADKVPRPGGGGPPVSRCPFRQYLDLNYGVPSDLELKSIEGFFLQGTEPGAGGGGGVDFGLYVITLTE